MTVETTSRKQNFDGGQADLEFTFRALPESPEDIKCIATSAAGDITDLEYGVDYTVAVNSDGIGGTVTLNPTFATTYTHTVYRETTIKQESDYDDYNPFPADTVEMNFDRLTLVAQEISEVQDRSMRLKISDTSVSAVLPTAEENKILGWNSSGTGIENKIALNADDVATAQEAAEAAVLAKEAAEDARDAAEAVAGWEVASQAEAEAGTDNTKVITPLRTFQAIKSLNTNSNPTNLLYNGDFEAWSSGASAAPDGWAVLGGTGGIVAKEGTIKKMGSYSASLTRNGINTQLTQYVSTERGIEYWKGRTLTFGCWVWCDTASVARIVLNERDGGSVAYSSFHPGDSDWHWLTATKTITTGGVTGVYCILAVGSSDKTAYFDGAMCVEGSSAFAFSPRPMPIEYLDTDGDLTANSDAKVPSQKAVKTYVDDEKPSLGAWVDKSSNYGSQQAATDGFVLAYSTQGQENKRMRGYTDGNTTPTTVRADFDLRGAYNAGRGTLNIMFPVRKGDYWRVVTDATISKVWWIPLG